MKAYMAKHTEPISAPPTVDQLFQTSPIHQVSIDDIPKWLVLAWDDLRKNPMASLVYGALFALAGLIFSFIANDSLFLLSVSAGFMLMGPFLAVGLYHLSYQIEQGKTPLFYHSLNNLRHNWMHLAFYAFLLTFLMTVWVRVAAIVVGILSQGSVIQDQGLMAMVGNVWRSDYGMMLIMGFMGIGFISAVIAFVTGVVTAQMLVHRQADLATAMSTSIKVCLRNPWVMTVWALTLTLLVLLGMALFYIGLIITMPLAAHASWHMYREIVGQEEKK